MILSQIATQLIQKQFMVILRLPPPRKEKETIQMRFLVFFPPKRSAAASLDFMMQTA